MPKWTTHMVFIVQRSSRNLLLLFLARLLRVHQLNWLEALVILNLTK